MKRYAIAGGIVILALAAWMFTARSGGNTIEPKQTEALLASGDTNYVFLDVRTLQEYDSDTGHLKGAHLIPVQELPERMDELEQYRGKTIIAYCRSGNRSGRAAKMLQDKGFKALNMLGGMLEWNSEEMPVEKSETK